MNTIEVSRAEFEQMQRELETLRATHPYKRLLKSEPNISSGKKYTRVDLGF